MSLSEKKYNILLEIKQELYVQHELREPCWLASGTNGIYGQICKKLTGNRKLQELIAKFEQPDPEEEEAKEQYGKTLRQTFDQAVLSMARESSKQRIPSGKEEWNPFQSRNLKNGHMS